MVEKKKIREQKPINITYSVLKEKSSKIKKLIEHKLWMKVLISLFLGLLLGIILGPDFNLINPHTAAIITEWLALPGNIFLQLIKMIIIPLVFSSIILGIFTSGDPNFLKKIGPKLALYFVITTTVAAVIGFIVAFAIHPGTYFEMGSLDNFLQNEPIINSMSSNEHSIPQAVVNILPSNPFQSIVSGDMLGVVIFTIIIGVGLLYSNSEPTGSTIKVLQSIQEVSMRIVRWAMKLIPYAVFGLMIQVTSKIGVSALTGMSMYILTVITGLLILMIFYALIIELFTRRKPSVSISAMKDVQLLAFSTSSSAAVMPLSIKTAEDKLNIKKSISEFIIPVGATINMDGTALYQVVATVFLAQTFEIHLSIGAMALIAAIAVGASIGAPAAPGTGIIILATILESVGIPAIGLALILGVDRILDMSRTSVNVTGDLTACIFFNEKMSSFFQDKEEQKS